MGDWELGTGTPVQPAPMKSLNPEKSEVSTRQTTSGSLNRPSGAPVGPLGPWLATLLYLPLLYGLGWLAVRPLVGLGLLQGWRVDQVDLLGTLVAFVFLLVSLPTWIRSQWADAAHPWRQLGLAGPPLAAIRAFTRGLLKALLLLALVTVVLLLSGQAHWGSMAAAPAILNGLLLLLGVGFAEELLFRGWLWGALSQLLGSGPRAQQRAFLAQAAIFSLVHTRFNLGLAPMLGLLVGLLLLGLALGLQRRADGGLLWGAVGLHGGLVGGWFVLLAGPLQLASTTPAYLAGPGGAHPNPIGSLVGWIGLASLLWVRRRWWRPRHN